MIYTLKLKVDREGFLSGKIVVPVKGTEDEDGIPERHEEDVDCVLVMSEGLSNRFEVVNDFLREKEITISVELEKK